MLKRVIETFLFFDLFAVSLAPSICIRLGLFLMIAKMKTPIKIFHFYSLDCVVCCCCISFTFPTLSLIKHTDMKNISALSFFGLVFFFF